MAECSALDLTESCDFTFLPVPEEIDKCTSDESLISTSSKISNAVPIVEEEAVVERGTGPEPGELSEYIEVEDPHDPGLVVFKARLPPVESKKIPDLTSLADSLDSLSPRFQDLSISEVDNDSANSQSLNSPQISEKLERVMSELTEVRAVFSEVVKTCQSLPQALEQIKDSLIISVHSSEASDKETSQKGIIEEEATAPVSEVPATATGHPQQGHQEPKQQEPTTKQEKELHELKESNAYLKSRVAVLELELCSINKKKYNLLLQCIDSCEHENATLKTELDNQLKKQCEIESLNVKCENLTKENEDLRKFIKDNCSTSVDSENLSNKCSELEKEVITLKKTIENMAQNPVSSQAVRKIILSQGTEIAFMRSESREIRCELDFISTIAGNLLINPERTKINEVITRIDRIRQRCLRIVKRSPEYAEKFADPDLNREEKKELVSQLATVWAELEVARKNNLELKEQLINLRKQSVGKVSIHMLPQT